MATTAPRPFAWHDRAPADRILGVGAMLMLAAALAAARTMVAFALLLAGFFTFPFDRLMVCWLFG